MRYDWPPWPPWPPWAYLTFLRTPIDDQSLATYGFGRVKDYQPDDFFAQT